MISRERFHSFSPTRHSSHNLLRFFLPRYFIIDVIFTIIVWFDVLFCYFNRAQYHKRDVVSKHCTFYVSHYRFVDYTGNVGYNVRDDLSIEPREKWRISWPVNKMMIY
jgi:hypothetical protein